MPSYLFSLGDSDKGPVGFCARVKADDPEAAVAKLREFLNEIDNSMQARILDRDDIEYVEVYFNPKAISATDIDEVVDAESRAEAALSKAVPQ